MIINVRKIFIVKEFNCVDADDYFIAKEFNCVDVNRFLDANSEKDFLFCIIKAFDYVILNEICVAKVFEIFYIFKSMFCD